MPEFSWLQHTSFSQDVSMAPIPDFKGFKEITGAYFAIVVIRIPNLRAEDSHSRHHHLTPVARLGVISMPAPQELPTGHLSDPHLSLRGFQRDRSRVNPIQL
jgi:hypothetical protein